VFTLLGLILGPFIGFWITGYFIKGRSEFIDGFGELFLRLRWAYLGPIIGLIAGAMSGLITPSL